MTIGITLTSINAPNEVIHELSSLASDNGINFVVVGDEKTPQYPEIAGCNYLNVDDQYNLLPFNYSKICPTNVYARKNIGYLELIRSGCEVIIETDDDNHPLDNFLDIHPEEQSVRVNNNGWVNVYSYFKDTPIWPRGFHLNNINDTVLSFDALQYQDVCCPIQNGLADENPDVDAIFRLTQKLPVYFKKGIKVAIGGNAVCPYNSQNTVTYKRAFELLYLPSYCSWRMTDIWRSFVAQRIMRENEWHVLFYSPTVYQTRNEHDLMKDFTQEIDGYINNDEVVKTLDSLKLKKGEEHISDNLLLCYYALIELGLIDIREYELLSAWLRDIKTLQGT